MKCMNCGLPIAENDRTAVFASPRSYHEVGTCLRLLKATVAKQQAAINRAWTALDVHIEDEKP